MSLPIDPDECIWTPEGQAYAEEQARRAYLLRLAQMEEMQEINALRRSSYGRWPLAPNGAFFRLCSLDIFHDYHQHSSRAYRVWLPSGRELF